MSGDRPTDRAHLVVVPEDAGPLVPLAEADATRSDVDHVLDDLFGEVDNDEPGVADAVLLTGGAAAIIASQIVALPAIVLIGGFAGLGLGAVLPIRSGLRQLRSRRRDAKIQALIGEDHLLDVRSAAVKELAGAHAQALSMAESFGEVDRLCVRNVAHGLVVEVALLLEGHEISSDTEARYVAARLDALRKLLSVLSEATTTRTDLRREATVAARIRLDAEGHGTAIDEASSLADDLRPDRAD